MPAEAPSLSEVARRLDVSPATLRRWTLFPPPAETMTLDDAARESGLEPELIRRIWVSAGFSADALEEGISGDDLQLLRYMAAVVSAGFPREAFLQLVRVYGQALARIADAEVKLFHLSVHEPLIRDGHGGLAIAEEMEGLATELLPLASPIMDHVHQRWLQHFIEQDVVGHLELEVDDGSDLGRMRVGIAFADLAGYTRLTEDVGEEEAVDIVERFVASVEHTLPEGARVIKTIGDEVMVSARIHRRSSTGRSASSCCPPNARCRASACTPAPRCIATATTSAAPSISRHAWGRGRRAAR